MLALSYFRRCDYVVKISSSVTFLVVTSLKDKKTPVHESIFLHTKKYKLLKLFEFLAFSPLSEVWSFLHVMFDQMLQTCVLIALFGSCLFLNHIPAVF